MFQESSKLSSFSPFTWQHLVSKVIWNLILVNNCCILWNQKPSEEGLLSKMLKQLWKMSSEVVQKMLFSILPTWLRIKSKHFILGASASLKMLVTLNLLVCMIYAYCNKTNHFCRFSNDQDVLKAAMIRFVEEPRFRLEIADDGQKTVTINCQNILYNKLYVSGKKNQSAS